MIITPPIRKPTIAQKTSLRFIFFIPIERKGRRSQNKMSNSKIMATPHLADNWTNIFALASRCSKLGFKVSLRIAEEPKAITRPIMVGRRPLNLMLRML